jgi:hypothetical protein
MSIYGVDLGTRRIAIACPETELVWSVDLAAGKGSAANKRQFPTEFDAGRELGRQLAGFLFDWQDGEYVDTEDVFVAERPFVKRPNGSVRTAIGQALSGAAALTMLPGRVVLIEQATWKMELCGNGHANKDDVRAWIEQRYPALAEACIGDENRFDAVGIALGSAVLAQAGRL